MTCSYTKRVLWAFTAECLLLALVFLWLDTFPGWALKTAAAVAVILPVIIYLTIAIKTDVYRSWQGVFVEIRRGLLGAARLLQQSCNTQNVIRLYQSLVKMDLYPRTADAWFALLLLPFKVYVFAALPILHIGYSVAKLLASAPNRRGYQDAAFVIAGGYWWCCLILLLGALLQALFFRRGRATQTVLVFLIGALVLWGILPG